MAAAARRRGPQGGGRRARVDEEQAANHRKENIAATEVPPSARDNCLAAPRGRGAIFLSVDAVAGATGSARLLQDRRSLQGRLREHSDTEQPGSVPRATGTRVDIRSSRPACPTEKMSMDVLPGA